SSIRRPARCAPRGRPASGPPRWQLRAAPCGSATPKTETSGACRASASQRRHAASDYGAVTDSPSQPRIAGELRQLSICGDTVAVYGEERRARVAVCIPVRNAEATLERCLESVLAQERVALRVVVVDNASTDGTFALACGRAAGDPRVVVY